MANESTVGFGFRAANKLGGNASIQGQTKYQLQTAPGVALMKNDPASIQDGSGDEGFIQDASFATTDDTGTGGASYASNTNSKLVGVLNGFFSLTALHLNQLLQTVWQRRKHLELIQTQEAQMVLHL